MAVNIKLRPSVDFSSIQVLDQKIMQLIADNIRANIRSKNRAGLDVDGNPHRPYSTNPVLMRTRFDSTKGSKGREFGRLGKKNRLKSFRKGRRFSPQRRSSLDGSQLSFVDRGGIGRKAEGSFQKRSGALKEIRSIKPYEPAPRTLDSKGNKQDFRFYPQGYRQYKKQVFGNTTVNMKNTGRLLNSIIAKARSRKKATVKVTRKLEAQVGARNAIEYKRKWWGIGDQLIPSMRLLVKGIKFKRRFFGGKGGSGSI